MSSTEAVAKQLYAAFQAKDGATMASLYAPEATFTDPVFPDLDGAGAGAMWRMLTGRSKDLVLAVDSLEAKDDTAIVTWTAKYTFTSTGRAVTNHVRSQVTVKDGRIIRQQDAFDFHGWATQAFGLTGKLLGGMGFFKKKVQRTAAESLAKFRAKDAGAR